MIAPDRPGRSVGAPGSPRPVDPAWSFHWPVAIGFAALCVLIGFPGRLNADSLSSLLAASRPGVVDNWHSATLGWFWGLPGALLEQPTAALAMQAALFGVFAGFLPRLPATPRGRIAVAGEWLLRIVLAASIGYVGKDAAIVLTMLIAVQLLRRWPRSGWRGRDAVPLALATLFFLLIKAPDFLVIVVAAATILPFFVRAGRRYVALVAGMLAIGALAVPLNRIVDHVVFGARDLHPDKQLVLFDLAGISVRTGQNAFAAVPGWPTPRLPTPASCFLPYMWDSFAPWGPCSAYSRAYDGLDGPLKRRWVETIAAHPLAYIRHRLAYTGYLMVSRDHASWGIGGRAINDATIPAARTEMDAMTATMPGSPPIARWQPSIATAPMRWLEATLFRFPKVQWAGFIVCLAILLASWLRRADGLRFGAILAAALGTGNMATLAVFGVADPGRYMWPTVVLAYVALLAVLAPADHAPAIR